MKIKFAFIKQFYFVTFFIVSFFNSGKSQSLYFPPNFSSVWDTISPANLGWCSQRVDSLTQYVRETNAKAFIILKDGKIVIEKYYGTFTKDSSWYWASAGKSLTSMLVARILDDGFINLNDSVSKYLGSGWTTCLSQKEKLITVRDQLCMTTGLDDGVINTDCTLDTCLNYLADAGTRWAYHNAPYLLLHDVIEQATGQTIQQYTNQKIKNQIGMQSGWWFNGTFFSTARDMARFGLFALANGKWNNNTIINQPVYLNNMKNSSNPYNLSYGYLWWLNGKISFMLPQSQFIFQGYLIPNAPPDMYAALGKYDQKIYIVPSLNMVVIRMGNAATTNNLALSTFDNVLWGKIMNLDCKVSLTQFENNLAELYCFPNPAHEKITISNSVNWSKNESPIFINEIGQEFKAEVLNRSDNKIELSLKNISKGFYILQISNKRLKLIID